MSHDFKKGDRVIVTNLRSGTNHPGTVVKPPSGSQYMNVRYDTGQTVRVGQGFVTIAR